MKFGFEIKSVIDSSSGLETIIELAKLAESLGFEIISIGDRLSYSAKSPHYDTLTTLTVVASNTRRVTLCSYILVLPYYNPVLLAQQIATLDVLSKGRIILGAGSGWNKDEFAITQVPYQERFSIFEEELEILKDLWSKDNVTYSGEHIKLKDVTLAVKPVKKAGIPIWIAAGHERGLRRAARLGDAWAPSTWTPSTGLEEKLNYFRTQKMKYSPEFEAHYVPLSRRCCIAKSSESAIAKANQFILPEARIISESGHDELDKLDYSSMTVDTIRDRLILGNPSECIEQIEKYKRLGITHLLLKFRYSDKQEIKDVIESAKFFAKEVMPQFKNK